MGIMGLHLIGKILVLFTASFFILFAASKTESTGLKKFGRLLSFAILAVAVYAIVTLVYSSIIGGGYMGKMGKFSGRMHMYKKQMPCK